MMTRPFVRYRPDVERANPDLDRNLQTVIENIKRHLEGPFKTERVGKVVRDAHAKGYVLAREHTESVLRELGFDAAGLE